MALEAARNRGNAWSRLLSATGQATMPHMAPLLRHHSRAAALPITSGCCERQALQRWPATPLSYRKTGLSIRSLATCIPPRFVRSVSWGPTRQPSRQRCRPRSSRMTQTERTPSRCASATPSAGSQPERKPGKPLWPCVPVVWPCSSLRAAPPPAADALQPPLRCGFQARLSRGVTLHKLECPAREDEVHETHAHHRHALRRSRGTSGGG